MNKPVLLKFDPSQARDAQGRWTGSGRIAEAVARLREIRAAGGQSLVYRGSKRPDFKPRERYYGATYVTTSKTRAAGYANEDTAFADPRKTPGWVTVYALPKATPLADMARLYSEPLTPIQRRAKIRWHAQVASRIRYPGQTPTDRLKMMLHSAKTYGLGRGEYDWSPPTEQDLTLETIHTGPTPQDNSFLQRLGFKGSKRSHAIALADPSVLKPLYARRADKTRRIVLAKAFEETKHPRDQSGRWTAGAAPAIAGAAAGAAAGGLASYSTIARIRAGAFQRARTAAGVLPKERLASAIRTLRHSKAEASIQRGLRNPRSLVPTAVRTLGSQARRADIAVDQHIERHKITLDPAKTTNLNAFALFPDIEFSPESFKGPAALGSSDPMGELDRRTRAANLRAQIADLRANARTPEARNARGRWKAGRAAIAAAKLAGLPKQRRAARVVAGYPDKAGRRALSRQVRDDLAARSQAFAATEAKGLAARLADHRTIIRANHGGALGVLRNLRGPARLGAIAAGAVVGAAGMGALAQRLFGSRKLGKVSNGVNAHSGGNSPLNDVKDASFPGYAFHNTIPRTVRTVGRRGTLRKAAPDPPDTTAREIFAAGTGVENAVANRLARTFGAWTRIPSEQLRARDAALRTTMLTDIDTAMAPLDRAAETAAGVPVPGFTQSDPAGGRLITASFDLSVPAATEFARANRLKLAGDMADEQLATIQSVIIDAANRGQAPAVTARLLRQTIGLTPTQAGHVISFRNQLAALDPNALNRALRDQRFDRTVQGAIASNTPLPDAQLDRMVDAYQRRYLALRAMTIARTEGLRAANNGHMEGVAGFLDDNPGFTVVKRWLSTLDHRTRDSHRALNGQQVIGLYTPFISPSGEQLLWPHDPNASAAETIQCRCSIFTSLVPRDTAARRGFSALDIGADGSDLQGVPVPA